MAIMAREEKIKAGYKLTEVGVIPEDWEVKLLGEIASISSGGTPDRSNPIYWNGDIPWVTTTQINFNLIDAANEFITREGLEHSATRVYNPGTLLMAMYGQGKTRGKVAILVLHAAINQACAAIKLERDIWSNYVFFNLSARYEEIRNLSNTGNQENLNIAILKSIPLPLPRNEKEQLSIVTALSDIDALITSLDKLIVKKRDIKQATMQQLLTGKTRLPEFSEELRTAYKQTEVGLIPDDWEVRDLGDVITDFRGGAPLAPGDFTHDGVKVLPKGGVARGGKLKIDENEQQHCSQKYADAHKNNQVNNLYTIVVLRDLVPSGPSIGLMVEIEGPDTFVLAQGVYGFKACQDKIDPEYLIQYSNGFDYRKLMNSIMVGSTQVHITNTALKKVLLPFPSLLEQQAIATVLTDMDAEIAALEQRREKTRMLKQGMMQELLTGKTRLV